MKETCKELSNDLQLEILKSLCSKKTIKELTKELGFKHNKNVYRETVYNKIEKLVQIGLVSKEYDNVSKKIVYYTRVKEITLDIQNFKIKEIILRGKDE